MPIVYKIDEFGMHVSIHAERDVRLTKDIGDKNQKDYFLREQIKAIQDELGDKDSTAQEVEDYLEQLENANVPEVVMKKAEKELSKLRKM
mgnify:CR=1 FL=1